MTSKQKKKPNQPPIKLKLIPIIFDV